MRQSVYRLGNPSYIDRLDGEGAAKVGGRWKSVDQAIVYTAQTTSLAILEVLGHIKNTAFYLPNQLDVIEIDSSLCMDYTMFSPELPEGWATKPGGEKIAKDIGTAWLSEVKAPYLKVPSVHNPLEHNYLLNPKHAEFEAKIDNKHWNLYHNRLIEK